ncbi:extracellular solute-binding protein [Cohnella sp. CFH 77786]|uniref:ABC transporter substrate-binding protein n=1 Tax=Cohnella sp. CFH 77786 TaxID=2662265 RepID=UPI001C60FF03|nr:sugar ABC transporter substrate-binding protein [Cohnella sp. CFH 77786]MBW5444811.1 extracellular solute-binding protein [Cohnella sp. CFH 77786]
MKANPRNRITLAAILALCMLIAGCGGGSGGKPSAQASAPSSSSPASASPSASAEPEKVEITHWRYENDNETKTIRALIDSFQKKYPHITVKLELIPAEQYETKIRTAMAGQSAPDIMAVDAPTIASYASQEAIIPLDEYMNADGDKDDILKPVLGSITYKDHIYAAPLQNHSLVLFYNKKMFEEKGIPLPSKNPDEPLAWEQLLDAAKKLTDPAKGVYGLNPIFKGFTGGEAPPYGEMPWIWQAGGEIISPDGKTSRGYLDSSESKSALEFVRKLFNEYKVSPKELPQDPLPNGKVAIDIQSPGYLNSLKSKYPDFKLGEDFDIMPLPKNARQATPMGSWNLAITSQSKHPKESWMFINWVTGVDGAVEWYKGTGNLPARQSTVDAIPELNQYPLNVFAGQSVKYAHPRPVTPAYPVISETIRELFEEIGIGNHSVDEAVEKAVKKIDTALAQVK